MSDQAPAGSRGLVMVGWLMSHGGMYMYMWSRLSSSYGLIWPGLALDIHTRTGQEQESQAISYKEKEKKKQKRSGNHVIVAWPMGLELCICWLRMALESKATGAGEEVRGAWRPLAEHNAGSEWREAIRDFSTVLRAGCKLVHYTSVELNGMTHSRSCLVKLTYTKCNGWHFMVHVLKGTVQSPGA